MARDTEVIYDSIINSIRENDLLNDLDLNGEDFESFKDDLKNQSKVGDLRNIVFLLSNAFHEQEKFYDTYLEELDRRAQEANYGHDQWWIDRIKEFQYGDELQIIEDEEGVLYFRYAEIDESKRIISRVSITDALNGASVIKVATGEDPLTALTLDQTNALRSYVNKLMPPGSYLTVLSKGSDKVKYSISLYYNPEFERSVVKADVENAIVSYHQNLNTSIQFDGRIDLRAMEDAIQGVPSVVNFVITSSEAKPEGDEYITFNREYKTISGYVEVDPDHPLSETITYLPYGIE